MDIINSIWLLFLLQYAFGVRDLAFQKPAFQHSNYSASTGAGNAVDGNASTYAQSNFTLNPGWYVDLGEFVLVDYLQVTHPRTQVKWPGWYLVSVLDIESDNPERTNENFRMCRASPDYPPSGNRTKIECPATILARYVAIGLLTLNQPAYLMLQEVEVYAVPATFEDHAFQQPAFQISTDPVFAVASSAVDGNTTTFAKTKHHTFPLWYVDLGESKVVRHLQITFHDTQPHSSAIFLIIVAESNMTFEISEEAIAKGLCYNSSGHPTAGERTKVECIGPRLGRYVAIGLRTDGAQEPTNLVLQEVEVYDMEVPRTTTTMVTSESAALQNQGTCPRMPGIVVFPDHFTECITLNTTTGYSSTKLEYHISSPKMKIFPVTFQGPGLDCRSARGIQLYVVPVNGSSVRCIPWSDLLSNGIVRCTYRCKCPDVCSVLEAYIDNRYPSSVCQIMT